MLLAGESGAALEPLEHFLAAQGEPLDARQLDVCEKILDREFNRSHDRVLPLYGRVVALGSRRHGSVILALESALIAGDLQTCSELSGFLGEVDAAWEHRILARYFVAAKDDDRAALHFLAAGRKRPDHFPIVAEMVQHLRKLGRLEAAQSLLREARSRLAPPDLALLEVRMSDLQPEVIPDVEQACTSSFADAATFLKFLRTAADRVPDARRAAVYARLADRFPHEAALFSVISILEAERRDTDSALKWIRRAIECAKDPQEVIQFRFHEFRLACHAGDHEVARAILDALPLDELQPRQSMFVGRFFAEVGEWDRALAFIERSLASLDDLDESTVSLIARVGRKSAGQYSLLRSIASRLPHVSASQMRAATALYEDWVTGPGLHHPAAAEVGQTLGLSSTALMAFKLDVLAPERLRALGLPSSNRNAKRRAVFYCSDRAYILPALVSLASLLHHNRGFDRADFHVVVSDEITGPTGSVLDALSRHFRVSIGVVPSSELAHNATGLRPSFGAFTGGQFLSEAAYYRIYMARKLAQTGRYEQLLYLDSDSVIGHGFDEILDVPAPESSLLMARVDAELPGVKLAIRRFGLQDGRYFNSGVLWFPRVNERLIEHLDDTVRVAVERNAELIFLDQCALNVAFADSFEPLPARFNFFAGPDRVQEFLEAPALQACFVHVLNRLKPWDSAYPTDSPIQRRWISELHALQRIVGNAAIRPFLETT
jgi:lipopolysaccharide biosynthesis glycosyltransferase